ncbi:MAG TPA: hypothetical protein VJ600_03165 [Holophagaceae bacterium]|nr:hypothetical protein [Holophagaceae bacterium]
MTWTPKPRPDVDPFTLPLDVQQGFLLSRLDGTADVATLATLTGLPEARVTEMLGDLVRMGAIDGEAGAPAPMSAPARDAEAPEENPEAEGEGGADEGAAEAEAKADLEGPEPTEAEEREAEAQAATHRQLFETRLRAMTADARAALARQAEEPELSALCFDPLPQIVPALLENPRFGPLQARLVAAHHRTTAGLDLLGSKAAFHHDSGVRRALLRNPLLPASLYRRLWSNRRLLEQYLVTASREAPEQVRVLARDSLRAAFLQRAAEEKVELILTTEGRCLVQLVGLTIDGHTTALLCRRTYVSTLLIQNLARWSAAPPALIAHLRKQDAVRRNPQLKLMLERHPNAS